MVPFQLSRMVVFTLNVCVHLSFIRWHRSQLWQWQLQDWRVTRKTLVPIHCRGKGWWEEEKRDWPSVPIAGGGQIKGLSSPQDCLLATERRLRFKWRARGKQSWSRCVLPITGPSWLSSGPSSKVSPDKIVKLFICYSLRLKPHSHVNGKGASVLRGSALITQGD